MYRLGKPLRDMLLSIQLSTKLTVLMMVFMLVPVIFLTAFRYADKHHSLIAEKNEICGQVLRQSVKNVGAVVDACEQTTRTVLGHERLFREIEEFRGLSAGDFRPREPLDRLQKESVAALVHANPTIHAVRLYIDDPQVPVLVPTIYHLDRMQEQSWFNNPIPLGNTWKFSTTDSAFFGEEEDVFAVLLNELVDSTGRPMGVLEVSTEMETLFGAMYNLEDNAWMGFVDSSGALHYNKGRPSEEWSNVIGSVVYTGSEGGDNYTSSQLSLGSHTILVARIPLPQFSGRLIYAVMLDDELRELNQFLFLFCAMMLPFSALCALLMNYAVRLMLRRFYSLVVVAQEVQRGNLDVEVPDIGQDEIGQFGDIFSDTIKRIKTLVETSVNRELLVKTTEIRALQNQINSHFIYNVLESIKMMAEIEERYAISDAVTSLGKLLRYSMKWVTSMVTLEEELDYIQHYISLLNLRYDFVITLDIQIPDHLLEEKIPKMSLQPIIENAVYHGIEEMEEDAVIRINVKEYGEHFDVEITDTGRGMTGEELGRLRKRVYGMIKDEGRRRGGIGLRNVQERIQLCYGSDYGLRLYSQENCFTKVIVCLPLGGKEEIADGKTADRGR